MGLAELATKGIHESVVLGIGAVQSYPISTVAGTILALCLLGLLVSVCGLPLNEGQSPAQPKKAAASWRCDEAEVDFLRRLGAPEHLHEEGTFVPSTGLVVNNRDTCDTFENEFCTGSFLSLHRATHDKHLDATGNYPHGKYFRGKKRLWEARVQLRFKVPPKSQADVFFGIELERYVPMGGSAKRSMDMVVRMLKRVVGSQVHHSVGDDPGVTSGELERPVFVMPLWAFDQFIVTPPGEQPPSLTDPALPSMGSARFRRVKEFKDELERLEFKVGATYTFCFWGISQWLDKLNWQIRMPLMSPLDFNTFCGSPPVHVVMYTLKAKGDGESRHLQSRKNYYFDLAFWSSKARPSAARIRELLSGGPADPAGEPVPGALPTAGPARRGGGWMCCSGR